MPDGARIDALLAGPVRAINIGLAGFARDLAACGAEAAQVDWAPPAGGKPELLAALERLASRESAIAAANQAVIERVFSAEPVLVGVRRAGELIPALAERRLVLHAGPPLGWREMCGPLRGAVCGALVFEGRAADLAAAERLAESGEIAFSPNHHHGAVGPMGEISAACNPRWTIPALEFAGAARLLRAGAARSGGRAMIRNEVLRNRYLDSVSLMRAARRLGGAAGARAPEAVRQAERGVLPRLDRAGPRPRSHRSGGTRDRQETSRDRHENPAGVLARALEANRQKTQKPVIASVTGTDEDPRGWSRQAAILREAGVLVAPSNARAAAFAATLATPESASQPEQ